MKSYKLIYRQEICTVSHFWWRRFSFTKKLLFLFTSTTSDILISEEFRHEVGSSWRAGVIFHSVALGRVAGMQMALLNL